MLTYSQVVGDFPHAKSTPPEVLSYLSQRGIDVTLAAQLQLKVLNADALFTAARGAAPSYPDNRFAIVFPHHSPLDMHVLDWWSARLVPRKAEPSSSSAKPALSVVHSFSQLTDERVYGGKMFCPPNTPPAAYIPVAPSLPDWHAIPKGSRIYLHESVIKAVNGARLGTYSVGLNGVWGWGSRKHNIALLPEIRDIPWKALDLQPVILLDTNINSSQQVDLAAKRLAEKLLEVTGRTATLLRMHRDPDINGGEDYGFDDYCVAVGDAVAKEFLAQDTEEIDVSDVELMRLELNQKVAVVRTLSRVADVETGTLMTTAAFTELVYAHYQAETTTADGDIKMVSVPKLWLKDPRRTTVESLAYAPGEERITRTNQLNTWRGMGVQPQAGSVDQWLTLLAHNAPTPELAEWILDWLAYPLQNLGAKLNTLLLLFLSLIHI